MNASRYFSIALAALFSAASLQAGTPGSIQDLGFITYDDAAIAVDDSLNLDFAQAETLPNEPAGYARVENCYSVATLSLASGENRLASPGLLSFACAEAPENAAVFGWLDGQWTKVDSWRDANGYVSLSVSSLTTYAVLAPRPKTPSMCALTAGNRNG